MINDLILRKRKEKKMTRANLAELVGIDTHYIYLIETKRRNPSSKLQEKIFKVLGIKVIYK